MRSDADVVPRHMLDLCKDLLRRALAVIADNRRKDDARMTPTLRETIEQFRNGLEREVRELEDELVGRREELDKADSLLDDLQDDRPRPPAKPSQKPKGKPAR